MSTILIGLKIAINTIGFLTSYISAEPRYIPGILIGVGLMLVSIMIPEKLKSR
jgi:hypothetical protein